MRRYIVQVHLILASFFAPVLIIVGLSGGLYLLDIEGNYESSEVYRGSLNEFDFSAEARDERLQKFLDEHQLDYDFEYTRGNSSTIVSRPTSRTHVMLKVEDNALVVYERNPDLIRSMIELHKGHGPSYFKTFQTIMALGLLIILISGLCLGLTSPMLRYRTIGAAGLGLMVFLLLAI